MRFNCRSLIANIRMGCGITGGVKSTHTATVLAFTASMGITRITGFPFLQGQPAGSVTGAALSGSFTVRAFSIRFGHCPASFSLEGKFNVGNENNKTSFGSLAIFYVSEPCSACIFLPLSEIPANIPGLNPDSRWNLGNRKNWYHSAG